MAASLRKQSIGFAMAVGLAIVVLVEHGGAGGKHAAPIAFQVIRAYNEINAQRAGKKQNEGRRSSDRAKPNDRPQRGAP